MPTKSRNAARREQACRLHLQGAEIEAHRDQMPRIRPLVEAPQMKVWAGSRTPRLRGIAERAEHAAMIGVVRRQRRWRWFRAFVAERPQADVADQSRMTISTAKAAMPSITQTSASAINASHKYRSGSPVAAGRQAARSAAPGEDADHRPAPRHQTSARQSSLQHQRRHAVRARSPRLQQHPLPDLRHRQRRGEPRYDDRHGSGVTLRRP